MSDNNMLEEINYDYAATKGSLIMSIDSFDKSVTRMKCSVLVPRRLNDINLESQSSVAKSESPLKPPLLTSKHNLYDIYCELRQMRKLLFCENKNKRQKDSNNISNDCGKNNSLLIFDTTPMSTTKLMAKFNFHVQSLKQILDDLSKTADSLTNVYMDDVQNMQILEYNNNEIKHYYTSNSEI